jgi:hypothetical protein
MYMHILYAYNKYTVVCVCVCVCFCYGCILECLSARMIPLLKLRAQFAVANLSSEPSLQWQTGECISDQPHLENKETK